MAILHTFFDESGKFNDHKVVAFCGFGASPSQIADFDKDWNYQLRRTGMVALHWVKARRNGKALSSKIGPQTPGAPFKPSFGLSGVVPNVEDNGDSMRVDADRSAADTWKFLSSAETAPLKPKEGLNGAPQQILYLIDRVPP